MSDPLASVDELMVLLGRTFDETEEAQAGMILRQASSAVRAWTRQTLSVVTGDIITLPGSWSSELELPERPVTAVTAVAVDGTTLDASAYALKLGRLQRTRHDISLLNFDPWYRCGWGGPERAVTVTYTHGYATIPDDVHDVVLEVAALLMGNPGHVRQESLGSYAVTYATETLAASLTAEQKAQLRRYRRWWN